MHSLSTLTAIAATSLALLLTPARSLAQPAAPAKEESTIAITGSAKVYRAPDYVDVMTGIEVYEKTASAANAAATSTMNSIVAAIKRLSLPGENLQTGSVDLSPRYEDHRTSGEDPRKIIGYQATITLRVRTTDIAAVAKVIDTALTAGANRVDYVQFGIKEALEAREEAIKLATKAAKRKAKVLAESLDLKLGRVITASVNSNQSGWWGANRYSNISQTAGPQSGGGGAEEGESVVPGKIEIWAETSISFGVEQPAK